MIRAADALNAVPAGLRKPLVAEYRKLVQGFMERRWSPTELAGGRFCEIVYTILKAYGESNYPPKPSKPRNFVDACRALEKVRGVPRSFQILIPRMLPALYEVRNNRGVGHVGGDVDPNHMDATLVIGMCNWVMAELVRVFHRLDVKQAQEVVDGLAERRVPLVWSERGIKRVLDPTMSLKDQVLLLVASSSGAPDATDLLFWTSAKQAYLRRILRDLHIRRLIEFREEDGSVSILPPGSARVEELVARHTALNTA